MSGHYNEDDLAYGDYHERGQRGDGEYEGGERGIIGDTFRKIRGRMQPPPQQPYGQPSYSGSTQSYQTQQSQSYDQGAGGGSYNQPGSQPYNPTGGQASNQSYYNQPPKQDLVSSLLGKVTGVVQGLGSEVAQKIGGQPPGPGGQYGTGQYGTPIYGAQSRLQHRYESFAAQRSANEVKWHVDGCSYMYAVSRALEMARESIWILDWWLSPELYLRRPPSKNEQYRVDRMLQAAAQRGVRVNIIVYKEVTQALTRKYLSPTLPKYLHSILPRSTDAMTSLLVRMGLAATFASIEQMEADNPLISPPLIVCSSHTKHALENLHPNISVFRHPDHLPDAQTLQSSLVSSLQNLSLNAATVTKLPVDAVKSLYGMNDGVILYWAHHEKLCLVDGRIAFMGGLDLCFGRWDTNQHPLADAHPSNLDDIVFPGQDYNNARIMDFQEVNHWQNNKLDRKQSSRMGWSDISISLKGPVVQDLQEHFVERWNFIYNEKYNVRRDQRYSRLTFVPTSFGIMPFQGSTQSLASQQDPYGRPPSSQGQPSSQQSSQNPAYGPQPQSQTTPQPYGQQFPPPPTSQSSVAQSYGQKFPPSPTAASPQPQGQTGAPPYDQQFPPPPTAAPPQPQGQTGSPPYGQQFPPPPTAASPQPQGQTGSQPYGQQFPPPPSGVPPPSSHQPYGGSYSDQSLPPPPPPPGSPPSSTQQSQYYSGAGNQPQYGQSPSTSGQSNYVELEGSLPTQTDQNISQYHAPPPQQTRSIGDDFTYEGERGAEGESERGFGSERDRLKGEARGIGNMLRGRLGEQLQQAQGYIQGGSSYYQPHSSHTEGAMSCQIVRSCTRWSHGIATEHSIQDAYIKVIRESQHFVYIENQFFITATGNEQKPVKNQIGAAIVERILRAARAGEKYKVIVVMPAIPGFAGDLKDESSLGTRAIMEFQYNSINRGGHSIMECIGRAGYNPMEYIRFYNLRNYDRINAGGYMQQVQQQSGVDYEDARRQHDDMVGGGYGGAGERTGAAPHNPGQQYQQYQQAAQTLKPSESSRWDTVSECYMLGGQDIRSVPWEAGELSEIEAFVSEELYIHSKVLIADDRVVICGSANLNDRSQLGTHDSEIAIIVEDPAPVESSMNGRPWRANRFAASLRRELFRKHLGLTKPQNMYGPDQNFEPVGIPNAYDWNSPEDLAVADPLSDTFQNMWNARAHQNTEVFSKVFHPVPDDKVRSWNDYNEYYEYYFRQADQEADGKAGTKKPAKYRWGHVVQDDFPPGAEGVRQVKELLSTVKGTLVEMPLMFLIEEDIAKEGVSLNALTEEIYT